MPPSGCGGGTSRAGRGRGAPCPLPHPCWPGSWSWAGGRGGPCTLAPLRPAEVTIPEQKPAKGKGPKIGSKEKRSILPESEVAQATPSPLSPARGSLPPSCLAPRTWACRGHGPCSSDRKARSLTSVISVCFPKATGSPPPPLREQPPGDPGRPGSGAVSVWPHCARGPTVCAPPGLQPPLSTGTCVLMALPLPAPPPHRLWAVSRLRDCLHQGSPRPGQGTATPPLGVPLPPR